MKDSFATRTAKEKSDKAKSAHAARRAQQSVEVEVDWEARWNTIDRHWRKINGYPPKDE